VDPRVHSLDPGQKRVDNLGWRDLSIPDERCQVGRGQVAKLSLVHGSPFVRKVVVQRMVAKSPGVTTSDLPPKIPQYPSLVANVMAFATTLVKSRRWQEEST